MHPLVAGGDLPRSVCGAVVHEQHAIHPELPQVPQRARQPQGLVPDHHEREDVARGQDGRRPEQGQGVGQGRSA
jgi:hypothetical protein